jgi:ketosteroid isomerase-like protein
MPNDTVTQTNDHDLNTLQQINSGYMRSVQASDVRWFDEHLAEDFMNSNPDGTFADRTEFLALIGRPCALTNFHAEDVRIRILGDVAIIHGRTVYAKPGGEPGAGRYTDIYARREGRWLCVAAHVTRG